MHVKQQLIDTPSGISSRETMTTIKVTFVLNALVKLHVIQDQTKMNVKTMMMRNVEYVDTYSSLKDSELLTMEILVRG